MDSMFMLFHFILVFCICTFCLFEFCGICALSFLVCLREKEYKVEK